MKKVRDQNKDIIKLSISEWFVFIVENDKILLGVRVE